MISVVLTGIIFALMASLTSLDKSTPHLEGWYQRSFLLFYEQRKKLSNEEVDKKTVIFILS